MTHGLRMAVTPRTRRTGYQEQQKPRRQLAEASALTAVRQSGMSLVQQVNVDSMSITPLDFFRIGS